MRTTLLLCLTALVFTISAQNVQEEINDQIWVPFTRAWEANDAEAFNALHTEEVLRVTPNGIKVGEAYRESNRERMNRNKAEDRKRRIEFWFEHRLADGDHGYEVGYYRVSAEVKGEMKHWYGRFHIVLKKAGGQWKIAQDWDTSEINGRKVTAEEYAKGESRHFE